MLGHENWDLSMAGRDMNMILIIGSPLKAAVWHYNCSRNWFLKTQTSQISELYSLSKMFANARPNCNDVYLRLATL